MYSLRSGQWCLPSCAAVDDFSSKMSDCLAIRPYPARCQCLTVRDELYDVIIFYTVFT